MQNNDNEMENEHAEPGRLLASVGVNLNDPNKLLRACIDVVKQIDASTQRPDTYLHPLLWHTKIVFPNSSPYMLVVEEGTANAVNEAFITFITTCHIAEIEPFLTFQFEKFYGRLRATQDPQLFFDYIIILLEVANQREPLYKAEFDTIVRWIHQHYTPAPATTPPANPDDTTLIAKRTYSVYDVAALCYYLEKANFNKFTSRAKFIKNELIPKYGFTLNSVSNKCSKMKNPATLRSKQEAIRNAIEIIKTDEQFFFNAAILLAQADLALIENNRQ